MEQMRREQDVERQLQRVKAAKEHEIATARDGAAAEAARIARELSAAREEAGASWDGLVGISPNRTQRMSRKERKQTAKSQKAIINMGMAEWLEEVSIVLEQDLGSVLGEVLLDGGTAMAEIFEYAGCVTVLSVLAKSSSAEELQALCSNELGEPMMDLEVAAEVWAHLSPLLDENKSVIKKERKELENMSKSIEKQVKKELQTQSQHMPEPEPEPEPEPNALGAPPPPPPSVSDAEDTPAPPPPSQHQAKTARTVETLVLTPVAEDGFGMDIEDDCSVAMVHEGSAAEIAGVSLGTVIVQVDGQPVGSKQDIIAVLTRDDAGESSTCVRIRSNDLSALVWTNRCAVPRRFVFEHW